MKVILKVDHPKLGDAGDIVDVRRGYANNYLFPRDYAIRATSGAIEDSKAIAQARMKREASNISAAQAQKEALAAKTIATKVRSSADGTLYGSIGKRNVAQLIKDQLGITINYKNVDMDRPIKQTGDHEIAIKLHRDVAGMVTIAVEGDIDPKELAALEEKQAKEAAEQEAKAKAKEAKKAEATSEEAPPAATVTDDADGDVATAETDATEEPSEETEA